MISIRQVNDVTHCNQMYASSVSISSMYVLENLVYLASFYMDTRIVKKARGSRSVRDSARIKDRS